jgi:hypothetical protein
MERFKTGEARRAAKSYKRMSRYKQLTNAQKMKMEAVDRAIEQTLKLPDGELRMKIVEMVLIDNTHTLNGAAQACYVSYHTAQRKLVAFVKLVDKFLKNP